MTDEPDLPPGVGPHEGREVELMLAGQKPLAMFYDAVPATVDLPKLTSRPMSLRASWSSGKRSTSRAGRELSRGISTMPSRMKSGASKPCTRCSPAFYAGRPATDEDDIEIGRLLGYSEAEIKAFIE